MSRSLVHAYLGDRRGLIDAVQVRIVARLDSWVDHGLQRADTAPEATRAVVTGLFAFVEAERDGWTVLVTTGGVDHPAFHGVRARWAAAMAGDDPDPAAEIAAQAAIGAVVLGVGPWLNRGVDARQVLDALRGSSDAELGRLHDSH